MKPAPIEIPRLRDHSPKLAELEARRDAIGALVVQKEAERLALGLADSRHDEPPQDPALRRAAELLGETPPPAPLDRKARLIKLATEVRDLKAADALLAGQIRVEKSKASAIVRGLVEPEYKRRARRVCEALIGLHRANIELQAMTSALEDEQVEWTALGVMSNLSAGNAGDPHSQVALDLRDSVRLGFIKASEIPEGLRG